MTEAVGKIPLPVVKLNGTELWLTDQVPLLPLVPTVKFTVMISGVPVDGVTVTVP